MDRKALSFKVRGVEDAGDHIYVNVFIPNDAPVTAQPRYALEAKMKTTKTETVLADPTEYYLSVIRFSCPLTIIPISVIGVQQQPAAPPPNINLTPYSVSLQAPGGPVRQTFLIWTPEDLSATVPSLDAGGVIGPRFAGRHLPFYSLFSYQHFVDMINTAFAASFALASGDAGWPAAATLAPWFSFDPVTQQCSLSAQSAYATATPSSAGIQVFFNSELMEFFQGTFQTIYNGFQGVPPGPATGTDYLMIIKDNGFNRLVNVPNNPPPAAASAGLEMKQEFAAVVLWTDFVGIQMETGLIPMETEYSATLTDNATDAKRPIVTDFFPQSSGSGVDLRTFLNYSPAGEYRLSDLIGDRPMNLLDLQVKWIDDLGGIHPVYVTHNTACSAKLMFRRKTFNKGAFGKSGALSARTKEECPTCASGGCMSCGGGKISRRR